MTGSLPQILLSAGCAGSMVFLGGLIARLFERAAGDGFIKKEIVHTSMAFGGGIIVAAVAFILVPKGMEQFSVVPMALFFLAGASAFLFLDKVIEKRGGSIAQLLAMLLDFIPESIALGAVFAQEPSVGLLLALFIGLQNFPESFNSYSDLKRIGMSAAKILCILFVLSFSGIAAAAAGYFFLRDIPALTGALMLFASGGILYLIFQDIAPMSKMKQSWVPAFGASCGYLIGMIGHKLLG